MRNLVYLDYAASTPIDERVVMAMAPHHGAANPSSAHLAGWAAADLIESAREKVAHLVGARPREVVFTAGATEADNIAIGGVLQAAGGGHVVTAASEHPAVLETVLALCPAATVLPVDRLGRVDPSDVRRALRADTVVVSIMAANNEVGTLSPMAEIGEACATHGVLFHTDAAQAIGKIPLDVTSAPVDLLSLSSHKMYGPKGIGALWINRRVRDRIRPIMHGGGHEGGLRSGTVNVAGCVGFGEAAHLAGAEAERDELHTCRLRARLKSRLVDAFPDSRFNGDQDATVPGIVNVWLPGVESESLLLATPHVAASTGSACSSGAPGPSHVLSAMGLPYAAAAECLRLSFGRFSTDSDIDEAVAALAASVAVMQGTREGVSA
ncbi:MAG: cysteine desulfurase family protein [Acidimicrobiales bacterium]